MDIEFAFTDTMGGALERGIAAGADFTPAMRDIAALLETKTKLRFETSTGPDGAPWLPSARVEAHGGKTLVDSGRLLASIASTSDATSAEVGTNVIYAAIHQFGGTITPRTQADGSRGRALKTPFGPRGAVTMPARPFLGFGADEVASIEHVLANHLSAAFEGRAT